MFIRFYFKVAIDNLEFCSMDPSTEHHYEELLHQWKNDEDNIKDELKEVATDVKEFGTVIKGVGTDVKEIGTDVKNLTKKLEDFVTSTVTPVREINDKSKYILIDTLTTRTISANTEENVNWGKKVTLLRFKIVLSLSYKRPLDSRTRTSTSKRFDSEVFSHLLKYRLPGEFHFTIFTRKISIVIFSERGYELSRSQNDKTSNI